MAQHDYNLANQSGADFRADLNNALSAIVTVNSGASAPSTTFAHQLWVDTSSNVLKIRNAANDAWVTTGLSITADNTFTGNITGNAATATALATARTINGASFDGTANISFGTDSVSEGSSNLYFTNARVESYLDTGTSTPTFASAVINTSITGSAILDDDSFGTASATTVATSESIKAYVDSQIGSVDTLSEILVNGNTTGGTDIKFGDDDKALFGVGNDLKIYHSANNQSYIHEVGSGDLNILATNLKLQDAGGSTKVLVNSTGMDVTGTTTTDGLTVSDGTNGIIQVGALNTRKIAGGADYGGIRYYSDNDHILYTNNVQRLAINSGGDISFYDDTGTTQALFWDSSAESLCLGNTSASASLDIRKDSGFALRAENNLGQYFRVAAGGNTEIGGTLDVSGTVTSDALTVQTAQGDISIDNSSSTLNFARAGASYIRATNSLGHFNFITGANNFTNKRLQIASNGDISFYDDTGTSQNLKWDASADSLDFVDGAKARFGAGNDFQVEHDGLDTTLKNYTGSLYFQNLADDKDVFIKSDNGSGGSANYFQADGSTGETKLFHYGSEKISTKSTGIDVTGTVVSDGLTVSTAGNLTALLDSTSGTPKLQFRSGSGTLSSFIQGGVGGTANLSFQTNGTTERMAIEANGDISFYDDTGSTQGLFWDASAEKLGIGTTSPSANLHVSSTGDTILKITSADGNGAFLDLGDASDTDGGRIVYDSGSNLAFYTASTERARIDSSGNIGIGTTNPAKQLHVYQPSGQTGIVLSRTNNIAGVNLQFSVDSSKVKIDSYGDLTFNTAGIGSGTGAGEKMRITAAGKVGIGTNAPGEKLTVSGNTLTYGSTGNVGAGASYFLGNSQNSRDIALTRVGSATLAIGYYSGGWQESARFDSSGRLLVGTTSTAPYASSSDTAQGIAIRGDFGLIGASRPNNYSLSLNRADSDGEIVNLRKSGSTVGRISSTSTGIALGTPLGSGSGIHLVSNAILPSTSTGGAADGSKDLGSSSNRFKDLHLSGTANTGGVKLTGTGTDNDSHILSFVNGACAIARDNNDLELHAYNAMVFGVSNTAYPTSVERARIDSSGNLLVGKTAADIGTIGHQLLSDVSGDYAAHTSNGTRALLLNRLNSDGEIIDFRKDGTTVGSISVTSSATTYNTSSDARLKDVTGEARGLEVITKLNPVAYNWKADGKADEGLIAQEVKELVPNAVTGSEDEHYQMDYSKLVTHLVKAVQELEQQTIELKKEIANLKGE